LRCVLAFAHQALQLFGFFGTEGDEVFFHPLILCPSCATPTPQAISDPPTLGS
jgi:hypothetical protein